MRGLRIVSRWCREKRRRATVTGIFPFEISIQIPPMFQSAVVTLESKWKGMALAWGSEKCLCFIIHVQSTLCYCAVSSFLTRLFLLCCNTTSDEKLIQIKDERDFAERRLRLRRGGAERLGFIFPPVMFCHSSTSKKSLFVSFLFFFF